MNTLKAAQNDLRQGWETPDGAICACCHQKVKLYKRKIYSVPALELVKLYKLDQQYPDDYHHISAFTKEVPVISKLLFWGLVDERVNEDSDKRTSGYWKITDKGRLFVEGSSTVLKYAYVYNNKAYKYSKERQGIVEALGNKFNYPELMGYLI